MDSAIQLLNNWGLDNIIVIIEGQIYVIRNTRQGSFRCCDQYGMLTEFQLTDR